jgi:CrcB protein
VAAPGPLATFGWVCLGGAVGTAARYAVAMGAARWLGAGFPYGTLAVNALGSFAAAAITAAAARYQLGPAVRATLLTGVMGGFTTYSAFNTDVIAMAQAGRPGAAAGYVAVTVVACLLAGAAGWWAGGRW